MKSTPYTALLVIPLLAIALWPALSAAQADKKSKTLYRWVDAKGNVQYGDKIPPEAAKREAEKLDREGRVRETRSRELTPDELAAAAEVNKLNKELAERQARKTAYDRALMMTYSSVADLQAARDERLANIDQRLSLAEKAVRDNEASLAKGRAEVPQGKTPMPAQQKRIEAAEQAMLDALRLKATLNQERAQTVKQFADDIEQFKAMKAARPG